MIQGIEKAAVGPAKAPAAPAVPAPSPAAPAAAPVPAPAPAAEPGLMDMLAGHLNKVVPALGFSGENAGRYGAMGGAGLGAGGGLLLHMLLAKKKNRKIGDYLKSMLIGSMLGGGAGYFGGSQLAPRMKSQALSGAFTDPSTLLRAWQQGQGFKNFPGQVTTDPLGAIKGLFPSSPFESPAAANTAMAGAQAQAAKAPKIPTNTADQESAEG